MESIIVGVIVAVAALWVLWQTFGRRKTAAGCGSTAGCSGCGFAHGSRRPPERLIQLRR